MSQDRRKKKFIFNYNIFHLIRDVTGLKTFFLQLYICLFAQTQNIKVYNQ